jgi:hypothetical protein
VKNLFLLRWDSPQTFVSKESSKIVFLFFEVGIVLQDWQKGKERNWGVCLVSTRCYFVLILSDHKRCTVEMENTREKESLSVQ